jgi:hypothetical protein
VVMLRHCICFEKSLKSNYTFQKVIICFKKSLHIQKKSYCVQKSHSTFKKVRVKSKRLLSTESKSKSCYIKDKGQKGQEKTNLKRQSTDTFPDERLSDHDISLEPDRSGNILFAVEKVGASISTQITH